MSELNLFNVDINRLFEQYTINEILEIYKKIQLELDKKKQELRFMVGERYRDVITAADAIKSMQNSTENLYSHIGNINEKCHNLQSSINIEDTKPLVVDKLKNFYRSVAIQIKILISIPEYIWMCLDNGDFLKAVHLYLFAIHIYTGLELDREHKIAETFTILSRLKLSIKSFRNRILDGINRRLQFIQLDAEEASNHLCAYMLLENKSQESAIQKFIELRQISLNDLLNSDISVHNVVRVQIINLMNCLICTIILLHTCFVDHENMSDGLVQLKMKNILSLDADKVMQLVDLELTPLLEYLPTLVKDFRPSCLEGHTPLSKEVVQSTVDSWLQSTAEILNLNLTKSLELITSVKTLHSIREKSLKIESKDNWKDVCSNTYLPVNFTVWNHFFQPLVSKRAEKLIYHKINESLEDMYKKFDDVFKSESKLERCENDIKWYVWHEEQDDISKDANEHQGLSMKTKGHSKKIVLLCKFMDEKYLELLKDLDIYLHGSTDKDPHINKTNTDTSVETIHLETHLRRESSASIEKLILHIEKIINAESNSEIKVEISVLAARFLQAVPQLCSSFVKSCSYGNCVQDWEIVHSSLVNKNIMFWANWLTSTRQKIKVILKDFLTKVEDHNMLEILPRWHTIDIEEQTEDKIFNSQIRIPSQPCIILLSVLSKVGVELNGILPHTLPKSIHTQFTETLADSILQRYENICQNETMNQNMAFQFLLDVKFLSTICVKRDNKDLMKRSQNICDTLRAKIDPFDLDVFYPYLQTNVKRSVIQSQTFFGSLLPAPAQLASLGTVEPKAVDNEPNILAISVPTTEAWFTLLPVTAPLMKTMKVSSLATQSVVQNTKHEVAQTKGTSESASSSTFVRSGAAAFFGAMTNDWFS